jgi:hypothetical protein
MMRSWDRVRPTCQSKSPLSAGPFEFGLFWICQWVAVVSLVLSGEPFPG